MKRVFVLQQLLLTFRINSKTTLLLRNSIVAQLYCCATLLLNNSIVAQLYCCTTLLLHKSFGLKMSSFVQNRCIVCTDFCNILNLCSVFVLCFVLYKLSRDAVYTFCLGLCYLVIHLSCTERTI